MYLHNSSEGASREAYESFHPGEADPAPLTLNEYYVNSYLPTIVHESQNWQNQVSWAMDGYIRKAFGKMPINEIKRDAVQRLFNSMPTLGVESRKRVRIVFSVVMTLAEEDEVIAKHPARKIKIKPRANENPPAEKIALTYEQIGKLIYHAEERLLPVLYVSFVACGTRIGETCAMNRKLVTKNQIKVDQQVLQHKGGAIVTKRLKTPQTRRTLPLCHELAEIILNCGQKSKAWVCSNVDGGYLLPNNVNVLLANACKAAGIEVITPHEMRHTFISLLENELEAPPAIVAALAGKKDDRVTAGYSHTHQTQLLKWQTRHFEEVQKWVKIEACYQKMLSTQKTDQVQNEPEIVVGAQETSIRLQIQSRSA